FRSMGNSDSIYALQKETGNLREQIAQLEEARAAREKSREEDDARKETARKEEESRKDAEQKAATEMLRRNHLKETEQAKANVKEARQEMIEAANTYSSDLKKIMDARLEDMDIRNRDKIEAAAKLEQTKHEMNEKIMKTMKDNDCKIEKIIQSHNVTMIASMAFIQNVPRSIAADKESEILTPMMNDARQIIAELRTAYNKLLEMVTEGASEIDMKDEAKTMSMHCEKARSLRTQLFKQLSACEHIDFHLKETAGVGLDEFLKSSNGLSKNLIMLRNMKDSIKFNHISELEKFIDEMEEQFQEVMSVQGPTTSDKAMQALTDLYKGGQVAIAPVAIAQLGSETIASTAQNEQNEKVC
ncbi:hypothetical protein PENTCL1PPCAC_569, partial [Pristionchus entomophagus]